MHKRDGTRNRGRMATRHPPNSVAVTISLGLAERGEDTDTP